MKKICIILFVMIISLQIKAQFSLGIGYAGTHPLGDLLANNYKDGNGLDLYFLSKKFPEYSRIQAQIGVDFNVFNTGERSISNVLTTSGSYGTYYLNNHHSALSFKIRFVTQENIFRYHFDLDLGNRAFYSSESLKLEENGTQSTNTSNFLKQDNAYFTGLTVGVLYQITDWLSLDAYTRVDFGKSANWLDINSFTAINNTPEYATLQYKTTNTTLLWAGINVIFSFKPIKFTPIQNSGRSNEQAPQEQNEPSSPNPPTPRGRIAR
jgi:hypothetical protein